MIIVIVIISDDHLQNGIESILSCSFLGADVVEVAGDGLTVGFTPATRAEPSRDQHEDSSRAERTKAANDSLRRPVAVQQVQCRGHLPGDSTGGDHLLRPGLQTSGREENEPPERIFFALRVIVFHRISRTEVSPKRMTSKNKLLQANAFDKLMQGVNEVIHCFCFIEMAAAGATATRVRSWNHLLSRACSHSSPIHCHHSAKLLSKLIIIV